MNYRVDTPVQLRAVLRGLRKARGLNQTEAGRLIGVSQRRLAAIEQNPGGTSFDQMSRLVLALGGHVAFVYDHGAFTPADDGMTVAEPDMTAQYGLKAGVRSPRSASSLAKDTW